MIDSPLRPVNRHLFNRVQAILKSVRGHLPETDCPLPETNCLGQETDCPVPETDCPLAETDCPLAETNCPLPEPPPQLALHVGKVSSLYRRFGFVSWPLHPTAPPARGGSHHLERGNNCCSARKVVGFSHWRPLEERCLCPPSQRGNKDGGVFCIHAGDTWAGSFPLGRQRGLIFWRLCHSPTQPLWEGIDGGTSIRDLCLNTNVMSKYKRQRSLSECWATIQKHDTWSTTFPTWSGEVTNFVRRVLNLLEHSRGTVCVLLRTRERIRPVRVFSDQENGDPKSGLCS